MSCQGLISLTRNQKKEKEEFCGGTISYQYEKGNFCEASWKNGEGESLVHVPEGQKASTLLPTGSTLSVEANKKGCQIIVEDRSLANKKSLLLAGQHLEKSIQSKEKRSSRKHLKELKACLVKLQKKLDEEGKEESGDEMEKILDEVEKNLKGREGKDLRYLHGALHHLYKNC